MPGKHRGLDLSWLPLVCAVAVFLIAAYAGSP